MENYDENIFKNSIMELLLSKDDAEYSMGLEILKNNTELFNNSQEIINFLEDMWWKMMICRTRRYQEVNEIMNQIIIRKNR